MASSSDEGFASDDGRNDNIPFEQRVNLVNRNVNIPAQHLGEVYCRMLSYVRVGGAHLLCLACYATARHGTPEDVHHQTHSTHRIGRNLRNHEKCFVCDARLFLITPQRVCLICNRM